MQQPDAMRLVGGTAALIRALAAGLPPSQLHFCCRVTTMRLVPRGVEVEVEDSAGGRSAVTAANVVAALPPRLLEAGVKFEPGLGSEIRDQWRCTPTWMAPYAKLFATYERPFWRESELSGMAQSLVGPLAEVHDATTTSGHAALFGFVGIAAEQRAHLGEAAIVRASIEQLSRIFGRQAADPRATLY